MALDRIALARFRNHADTTLEGTARINLLVGENGAGKTNVLEALSLLAPGRGLRRAALPDMAQQGSETGFAIGASLCEAGVESARIGTSVEGDPPSRRQVRINGAQASAAALAEWVAVGWLTPAMDGLFTGSAGGRRRWLDRLAVGVEPAHAGRAARYEAALRERNRLLTADRIPEARWFDAIEAQLAEHGDTLSQGRARLVEALNAELTALPEAPFARPLLTLQPAPPGELRSALASGRGRDRAAGRTLAGPHRAEIAVTMAGKDMPAAACSTGEQKAMLIALTLAHAALAARGRPGVLLLDEVAAHLDPLRRAALFDRLRGGAAQAWLTGTDLVPFDAIREEAAVWRVSDGRVERV